MSIIIPQSLRSNFASGGIYEPTVANFPALKMLFKCNEVTNQTITGVLTDSISGCTIGVTGGAGGLVNNGDGTITPDGALTVLTGTLPDPTGKKVLVIFTGKPTGAGGCNMSIGTLAGSAYGIRLTTVSASATTTTNCNATVVNVTNPKAGNSTAGAWAVAADYGNATGLNNYAMLSTDTASTDATAGSLALSTVSTWSAAISIAATMVPSMISVWYFTTMPSAGLIKTAMAFQMYHSMTSPYDKWVYPGFRGVS